MQHMEIYYLRTKPNDTYISDVFVRSLNHWRIQRSVLGGKFWRRGPNLPHFQVSPRF